MEGIFFAIFIIFILMLIPMFILQRERHRNSIEEKIREIGGSLVEYERASFFSGLGPFMIVGKGRVVYKITYIQAGATKEGWVRFGGLFGPDWRL